MKLTILSPERTVVRQAEVSEVTLTTTEGQIQVLPDHERMIGLLETGVFSYRTMGGDQVVGAISTGFYEVRPSEISVLPETLELKGEIDVSRAHEAQLRAEKTLTTEELSPERFNKYQLKLQRALVRQQIAGKSLH